MKIKFFKKKIHSDYNYNIYFSRMVVSANGKDYHSVDIQLQNVIFPKERLENTPSMEEGLDEETEYELRNMGAELIQKAGIYLRLPQVAIATAQVIFQVKRRFKLEILFEPEICGSLCLYVTPFYPFCILYMLFLAFFLRQKLYRM